MHLIRKCLISFFVIFFISSTVEGIVVKDQKSFASIAGAANSISKDVAKKYQLKVFGFGHTTLKNNEKAVHLTFTGNQRIDIPQARLLLKHVANDLLIATNQKLKKKGLSPLVAKDIEISIYFEGDDRRHVSEKGYLAGVSKFNGKIFFDEYDNNADDFINILTEPFDNATDGFDDLVR